MALLVGCLVGSILVAITVSFITQEKQNEELEITNSYIDFQDDVEAILYENVTLINGYIAFVQTSDVVNQTLTEEYLANLIADRETYIRNIAVIDDTTIVYNYPYEGNEASIGVDLSKVEGQSEVIIETKETMLPRFQGPVNLVQGGTGFIIRYPYAINGSYSGQLSIVLNGETLLAEINRLAIENNLHVIIKDESGHVIMQTVDLLENGKIFDFSADLIQWQIELMPRNGWRSYVTNYFVGMSLTLIFSLLVAYLVWRNIWVQIKTAHQANHDFLTGLYNRNFLDEYQEIIFSKARRFDYMMAFMLIDINKFKKINDTYGHHSGDEVLKHVSKILKAELRTEEAVFRLGGDEFLVVFPEIMYVDEVKHVQDRIKEALEEPFVYHKHKIDVTISSGFSIYPHQSENMDHLLSLADSAMYDEKKGNDHES